jgi:hypothetical protein
MLCTGTSEMGNRFRQSAGPNLFKSDWLAGVAKSHAGSAALLAERYFCFHKVQQDWLHVFFFVHCTSV